MKKFLAMLLAMVMMLGCVAFAETVNPDEIPDTVTAEDGKYEIAFVTDVGQLKDKSFNQGSWNGVKLYAHQNGLTYKYYQPANGDQATDDDRYDAMKAACENGAGRACRCQMGLAPWSPPSSAQGAPGPAQGQAPSGADHVTRGWVQTPGRGAVIPSPSHGACISTGRSWVTPDASETPGQRQ